MNKVVIPADLSDRLRSFAGPSHLTDEAGNTLGYVLPPKLYAELMLAWASREPTPEELAAAREEYRTQGGKTTAEVLAHLEQVRLDWEAGRG
jgi:hypothetical protein